MYSKKIQENVQKNILTNLQTKNSLDFSGLFLGPEKKQRKLEKSSRGEKILQKKNSGFSPEKKKKRRNLLKKKYRKKILQISLYFLAAFWHFFSHYFTIFYLLFDYFLPWKKMFFYVMKINELIRP